MMIHRVAVYFITHINVTLFPEHYFVFMELIIKMCYAIADYISFLS